MTSCPQAMVLRIWRFWKRVSWELTLDHVGRQLGSLPLRQTVEVEDFRLNHASGQLSFCHWDRELSSLPLSWVSTVATSIKYFGSRPAKINRDWTMRCAERLSFVSVVWYERLLWIVSLLVSKNGSQVINKPLVPEQRSRLYIWTHLCVCICICTGHWPNQ